MPTKTGKPNRMGATFAERKAAREGEDFESTPAPETGNTTFAERGGKSNAKAVDAETDEVEDKAVAPKKTTSKRKP